MTHYLHQLRKFFFGEGVVGIDLELSVAGAVEFIKGGQDPVKLVRVVHKNVVVYGIDLAGGVRTAVSGL